VAREKGEARTGCNSRFGHGAKVGRHGDGVRCVTAAGRREERERVREVHSVLAGMLLEFFITCPKRAPSSPGGRSGYRALSIQYTFEGGKRNRHVDPIPDRV